MRRRIAVYGATDQALALLPALARRRDLELVVVYDPEARMLRRRLAWIEPGAARLLQETLSDDPRRAAAEADVVIDGGLVGAPAPAPPGALSPAAASRLLDLAPEPWREPRAPDRAPPRAHPAPAPQEATPARPRALERAIAEGRRFALLRCDARAVPGAPPPEPALLARVRRRAAEALRDALAPGERLVVARDGSLLALLPLAADADPTLRLLGFARRAAEQVAKELGDAPQRTPLVFGYAIHPDEASRPEELLARAARSRIRML